jgi:hypothetical protein
MPSTSSACSTRTRRRRWHPPVSMRYRWLSALGILAVTTVPVPWLHHRSLLVTAVLRVWLLARLWCPDLQRSWCRRTATVDGDVVWMMALTSPGHPRTCSTMTLQIWTTVPCSALLALITVTPRRRVCVRVASFGVCSRVCFSRQCQQQPMKSTKAGYQSLRRHRPRGGCSRIRQRRQRHIRGGHAATLWRWCPWTG